ncbi:hypothetical protein P153DRAFT_405569, partial [Dothidotthia symphoricarpi CBS 119687]
FIFRIDEIAVHPHASPIYTPQGSWVPGTNPGSNVLVNKGVSGRYWFCDGRHIYQAPHVPQLAPYDIFSVYYSGGSGFWVLKGVDATKPPPHDGWHLLSFDHDQTNHSSYLTNAGTQPTLKCSQPGQQWARMLLPDIYHAIGETTVEGWGGLKGELGILLALFALSVSCEHVEALLPHVFVEGKWMTHDFPHGRQHKRGVVVHVHPCPATWAGGSTPADLAAYENGKFGNYFD